MNRCKTCRFFGEPYEYWDHETDANATDFNICNYVQHLNSSDREQEGDLPVSAAVIDGSGYYARLVVKDDFGCVNWDAIQK